MVSGVSARVPAWQRAGFRLAAATVLLVAALSPLFIVWQGVATGSRITAPETPAEQRTHALPPGAVILDASAARLTFPFQTVPEPASPGGAALSIPEGKGDKSRCAGRAEFAFEAPDAPRIRVWLRCRWNDGCGNSVQVQVNSNPPLVAGQDAVYDVWHWVNAGVYRVEPGRRVRLVLREREDGVAIDQVCVVPASSRFIPRGGLGRGREAVSIRRFADRFDRSPGHGNPDWDFEAGQWGIAFTLDPNRIPYQYSLQVIAGEGRWAVAAIKGQPWRGARVRFNVCMPSVQDSGTPASACAVIFRGGASPCAVLFDEQGVPPPPGVSRVNVLRAPFRFAPDQWYAMDVRRWGWSLHAAGPTKAFTDTLPEAGCGRIALAVFGGKAVVDDVEVDEIPWAADDGGDFHLAWAPATPDARWYRPRATPASWTLAGRRGGLRLMEPLGAIAEAVVTGGSAEDVRGLRVPGFDVIRAGNVARFTPKGEPSEAFTLETARPCRLRRVALRRYVPDPVRFFHIGPFTFDVAQLPDPSDYLDFTPEEYERIRTSPDAQRLLRKPKMVDVVGKDGQYCLWARLSGNWRIAGGVLHGRGPDGRLRFWQEIEGPIRATFRVRLRDAGSAAGLLLGEREGRGIGILIAGDGKGNAPGAADSGAGNVIRVSARPGVWTRVRFDLRLNMVRWSVDDGKARTAAISRGDGGGIVLFVEQGEARFDDVALDVPRYLRGGGESAFFYAFDRREPDWLRRGRWIDHGGISCALASEWVSLEAPDDEGWLVWRRSAGKDVLAAFNIEENTEWFGWNRRPTHVHYPYDNVCVLLAETRELKRGYRLEVNSRNRSATVLYRNGKQAVVVPQDARFPIQYRGGHAPYSPRRNRICVVRRGAVLRVVIDGREVLRYEDPAPIRTPVLAIGGYKTRVNFSRIVVRTVSAGER